MRSKLTLVLCISFTALAPIGCSSTTVQTGVHNLYQSPEPKENCLSHGSFSEAMNHLSFGSQTEVDEAKELLIEASRRSTGCRARVITMLMTAMDKPNLDFKNDEASYYLWRYGSELLGDLKATEALDLLISHLTLTTSTFSASMTHQPAMRGIIMMGPVAIPKLDDVLKRNPDPKMRHSAVYCIATIGGPSAVESLKKALPTESDKCVSRLIRTSLDSFDNSGNINDRGKWFSGVLCNE